MFALYVSFCLCVVACTYIPNDDKDDDKDDEDDDDDDDDDG